MTLVGIIGTVHTNELRQAHHFPLSLLEELIVEFQPDLICGEVRPEDWDKYIQNRNAYKGYLGPSEYRTTIIPLCEEKGIDFHPIDWFDDSLTKLDHFETYSEKEHNSLEQQLSTHYDNIFKKSGEGKIPFNSFEVDEWVKRKHNWLYTINPVYQNLTWNARNQMMLMQIKRVIEAHPEKRILCSVGFEHNYYYYEELSKVDSVNIHYPLR